VSDHDYVVAFPLKHAYLCANCDCVGNWGTKCPVCQSEQLLSMDKLLSSDTETEKNPTPNRDERMQQPHRDSGLPSLEQISEWKKLRD
jgi:hypothetical protein